MAAPTVHMQSSTAQIPMRHRISSEWGATRLVRGSRHAQARCIRAVHDLTVSSNHACYHAPIRYDGQDRASGPQTIRTCKVMVHAEAGMQKRRSIHCWYVCMQLIMLGAIGHCTMPKGAGPCPQVPHTAAHPIVQPQHALALPDTVGN